MYNLKDEKNGKILLKKTRDLDNIVNNFLFQFMKNTNKRGNIEALNYI